jgi:hypothetical protein
MTQCKRNQPAGSSYTCIAPSIFNGSTRSCLDAGFSKSVGGKNISVGGTLIGVNPSVNRTCATRGVTVRAADVFLCLLNLLFEMVPCQEQSEAMSENVSSSAHVFTPCQAARGSDNCDVCDLMQHSLQPWANSCVHRPTLHHCS